MIKGLYTTPPGCDILKNIARMLVENAQGDMQALRMATILLPTRRAIRVLEEELLNHVDVDTVLLPRIMAIGDIELPPEDEESGRLPPRSISGLERIASLLPYVEKHGLGGHRFESQWRMAQEVAKLIDLLQTEDLDVNAVSNLLKDSDVAEQWQRYGQVFETIASVWIADLAKHKRINSAAGRTLRIHTMIETWRENPPQNPVWLVGSTGSIPAVRRLMKEVLQLCQGAVVLPGVDLRLTDAAWAAMNHAHPQAILKQTISELHHDRREIQIWPQCQSDELITDRQDWLSAALSPFPQPYTPQSAENVSLIVSATAQEEAETIAEYCLYHMEERAGETLVIASNDSTLPAKLLPLLSAYDITLDPSAGLKIEDTDFGQGLSMFLRVLTPNASYLDLWTLLKRDQFAPLWPREGRDRALREIEESILRKPIYRPDTIDALLPMLPDEVAKPLIEARRDVTGTKTLGGWSAFLAQELGKHFTLRSATDKLAYEETLNCLDTITTLPFAHTLSYEDAIAPIGDQLRQVGLRLPYQTGRVVRILGTMEARLMSADTVVIAGLNEGKWPDIPQPSPFLSRGMRQKLTVPDSERHAALSGHDFQQAFMMKRIVLSYAQRDDSAPILPARWLMRLRAVTDPAVWDAIKSRGDVLIRKRRQRHTAIAFVPAEAPAPIAGNHDIPFPLFVTQLETWRNDPYSFWAKHICNLRSKDPVFAEISAADKGTLWHKIFKRFAEAFDPALNDHDAHSFFESCIHTVLDEDNIPKAKQRVWKKRLDSASSSFIAFERDHRKRAEPLLEQKWSGKIGDYAISAKADRVDKTFGNTMMIADYKTGDAPSKKDMEHGYACQLSALALLMDQTVDSLEYITVKGGREPFKTENFAWTPELAEITRNGIINWIEVFGNGQQAFVSLADLRQKSLQKAQDYLHLARHKEWGSQA